jgi:DNA mismatch repair protein MutL
MLLLDARAEGVFLAGANIGGMDSISQPSIRVLDPETIGQIAAGEVIERPLSVVKELVENALDAGATRIGVRIRGGGLDEIEVSDDGLGMPERELALAIRRHATSKLRAAADLGAIGTLGFRGEGLASIAAVARLRMISRTRDAELGSALDAHGEVANSPVPIAAPVGTRAIARDLFANVPVRREYLRSARAEFARISNWLATIALAYPAVTFSLAHDGDELWTLPSDPTLELRLAHVFGKAAARMLLPLRAPETPTLDVRVRGFISAPGNDRPDRRMQVLFVNDRLLRSSLFAGAWSAAYSTYAMVGRQPYGVLFVDVAPSSVDPNVHPTKSDVRLRYGDHVASVVRQSLSATLGERARERFAAAVSLGPAQAAAVQDALAFGFPEAPGPDERGVEGGVSISEAGAAVSGGIQITGGQEPAARLRVLAQLDASYILATDGRALVIIDQHAAHERVVYERFAANASLREPSEPLLIPYDFEVSGAQDDAIANVLDELRAIGLGIERFGERVYRIDATPAGYALAGTNRRRPFDPGGFLECLGDDFRGLGPRERVWASLACHSVARFGERLELAEMTELLTRLERCRNPMHCPHGRPTIVRLEPSDIARMFKRL